MNILKDLWRVLKGSHQELLDCQITSSGFSIELIKESLYCFQRNLWRTLRLPNSIVQDLWFLKELVKDCLMVKMHPPGFQRNSSKTGGWSKKIYIVFKETRRGAWAGQRAPSKSSGRFLKGLLKVLGR